MWEDEAYQAVLSAGEVAGPNRVLGFVFFETVCYYVDKQAWNLLCSPGLASIWILLCPTYPVQGLQVCTIDAKHPSRFFYSMPRPFGKCNP